MPLVEIIPVPYDSLYGVDWLYQLLNKYIVWLCVPYLLDVCWCCQWSYASTLDGCAVKPSEARLPLNGSWVSILRLTESTTSDMWLMPPFCQEDIQHDFPCGSKFLHWLHLATGDNYKQLRSNGPQNIHD